MPILRNTILFVIIGIGLFLLIAKFRSQKERSILNNLEIPENSTTQSDSIRIKIALAQLVYEISAVQELEADHIGIDGRKSTQPRYFDLLTKWATIDQLVQLTDHESALVRSMSFRALQEKKYPGLKKIFEKHLYDNQTYEFHNGCSVYPVPVNADFYNCLYPSLTAAEVNSYKKKLMEKYKGTFYEYMFFHP